MMHQSIISILSTLIILSSGLPPSVSALRLTHTQALAPTSPPPKPSAFDTLTAWPGRPVFHVLSPSTTIQINAISIPADIPIAGVMFEALNRLIHNLDRDFPSPYDILPHDFFHVVTVSATTDILVVFSAGERNHYTWGLARSVLVAVAAMEQEYGSAQLDEAVVHEIGEQDRIFRLRKFDTQPNAGDPILPVTLPSSSRFSRSLSPSQALTSADLREWPDTPIDIDILPGRVTLTILKLAPVQNYPTIGADIGVAYDKIAVGGPPDRPLPPNVTVWEGKLTMDFFSVNLERGIALQVLQTVAIWEALHGAAELQRTALVIDGTQGGFTLRISGDGGDGPDEETQSTNISRRSLSSTNKGSVIFSLDSPSQNVTIDEPSADLMAWPPLPIFLRIDPIHLFMNITAISPAQPPYVPILASIQGIILELVSADEPPSALLPDVVLTHYFGRVAVTWTSLPPRRMTYGMALRVMETVLELELGHGIQQLLHTDIKVRWQIWGHFSLVISDYDHPLSPAPHLTHERNGGMMKKKREDRVWPRPPIVRILSRTLSIYISSISPGIPPYDTIFENILTLRNQLASYGPPQTFLGINTFLATGRVEVVFTEIVPHSLTVGIAAAVMDEVLDLEVEYGPQELNAVDILVHRSTKAEFSLVFTVPERANETARVGGIGVGRQVTD